MPFYTSPPSVEEEKEEQLTSSSSTFLTAAPVEETVKSEPVKSYGFLSSALLAPKIGSLNRRAFFCFGPLYLAISQ